jgi:hypothetical protein
MNLADYLSELLGQHDEVSVPGLGYFVRVRVNAHYNEKESKFYPPYHQVKFVPEPKDDDTFTQYIADKKNISLASSKYFAEKFITKLKEEAAKGKYLFADLGMFYTEQEQLVFKPNDKIPADPAFYGYPQVNINKLGASLSGDQVKPVFAETNSNPVVSAPPVQTFDEPQYFEEETERKRSVNIWLLLMIALSVFGLALFGVYTFFPQAFDKLASAYHKIIGKQEASVPVYRRAIKADTAKKAAVLKDTAAETIAPVKPLIDTIPQLRFEIIGGKFQKKHMTRALAEVEHFKSIGIEAKILPPEEVPGTLLKISVGTYPGIDAAEAERQVLIKAGKIKNNSEILQITPKK